MPNRYSLFSLVLAITIIAHASVPSCARQSLLEPEVLRLTGNPETLLAMGAKIPLSEATEASVQLIPGVAANLARQIVEKRAAILREAGRLPYNEKHRALELVRGVGPKNAEKIAGYLALE